MIDADIIERMEAGLAARVLIIGDIMLDRFVYGSADRISPEAPVPVLKFTHETVAPGGAANLARNVLELGGQVELIGLVGQDAAYDTVREFSQSTLGWRLAAVARARRRTPTKTRYIADRHHIMRLDVEDPVPADEDEEAAILTAVEAAFETANIVVLSDYAKGTLTPRVLAAVIAGAKRRNLRVIVDPKSANFRDYAGADLITPNRPEFERAIGRQCGDDEGAIISSANELLGRASVDSLLITRGERGMTLVRRCNEPLHFRSEARQVFDVSGAGDTVVAVLSVLMASGISLIDAAYIANIAAGLVVAQHGTATVKRDELASEIRRRRDDNLSRKIVGLKTALWQRSRWAADGESVVFTNGCFDLLHPGHVSLLRQAKAAGRRLIVGLNSDASVRRLKGQSRPIQDQESRARVLSAMEAVDLVIIFSEDTPYELIKLLRPDVLVKGADYNPNEIIGRELVEDYGGRLVLAELELGHSTTRTIERFAPRTSLPLVVDR